MPVKVPLSHIHNYDDEPDEIYAAMILQVSEDTYSSLSQWFDDYVQTFASGDVEMQRNMEIKIQHTHRVVREITHLGNEEELGAEKLRLAQIIALLHDVGRFEQFRRYHTFSDGKSENHAELGIRILKELDVLQDLESQTRELVCCAIANHNKPRLPGGETKECLFYSGLIRDADKLDIWKVVTDYYHSDNGRPNHALVLELPDTPGINEEVYRSLMNGEVVHMENVKNINDIKLLQAGWVYDINFRPALECVIRRAYIEKIRSVLPETKETGEIFTRIHAYLKKRLENGSSPMEDYLGTGFHPSRLFPE